MWKYEKCCSRSKIILYHLTMKEKINKQIISKQKPKVLSWGGYKFYSMGTKVLKIYESDGYKPQ